MSGARIREDLGAIVGAAGELLDGTLDYERAMAEDFPALLAAHGGDATRIWSIDGAHHAYLGGP